MFIKRGDAVNTKIMSVIQVEELTEEQKKTAEALKDNSEMEKVLSQNEQKEKN